MMRDSLHLVFYTQAIPDESLGRNVVDSISLRTAVPALTQTSLTVMDLDLTECFNGQPMLAEIETHNDAFDVSLAVAVSISFGVRVFPKKCTHHLNCFHKHNSP